VSCEWDLHVAASRVLTVVLLEQLSIRLPTAIACTSAPAQTHPPALAHQAVERVAVHPPGRQAARRLAAHVGVAPVHRFRVQPQLLPRGAREAADDVGPEGVRRALPEEAGRVAHADAGRGGIRRVDEGHQVVKRVLAPPVGWRLEWLVEARCGHEKRVSRSTSSIQTEQPS